MGMPLGAVADDGHFFGLNEGEVCIVIVVSRCHSLRFFLC